MPSERIGDCGCAQYPDKDWIIAELELGICYIRHACGEPPPGYELEIIWREHYLGQYAEIGVTWEGYGEAPWEYIGRAGNALSRFDDNVAWSELTREPDGTKTSLDEDTDVSNEEDDSDNKATSWPQATARRAAEKEEIPWFLHSFVNPPTDPLTLSLLALVEDLPSIPGPKTVGSENYSRILNAFMRSGWVGFEEEFDRIVPRDRPDYADVKRNMLCEPMFSMRAHRNMADAVVGNKTVDEIFEEMEQKREKKHQ